jgi:hypothetical protein
MRILPLVIVCVAASAFAGSLRGTIFFPADSKPDPRPLANWRVENGILPITPAPPESRSDAVVVLEPATPPEPTTAAVLVEARALALSPRVTVAAVGTTFQFKNLDRTARSLFLKGGENFMAAEPTAPGATRALRFSSPGEFDLRDADYPHAQAMLVVVASTFFAHADDKGSFKIDAPDGKYTLKVFFHGTWAASQPVEVGRPGEVQVHLNLPEEPHK